MRLAGAYSTLLARKGETLASQIGKKTSSHAIFLLSGFLACLWGSVVLAIFLASYFDWKAAALSLTILCSLFAMALGLYNRRHKPITLHLLNDEFSEGEDISINDPHYEISQATNELTQAAKLISPTFIVRDTVCRFPKSIVFSFFILGALFGTRTGSKAKS